MIPETIRTDTTEQELCQLAVRWTIHPSLARGLLAMAKRLPFQISIISGYRTVEQQLELKRVGRPAASPELSNHCSCPATAADLSTSVATSEVVKAYLGEAATIAGLRWGGGSPVDPDTGIPSDWNHVDLGPRRAS